MADNFPITPGSGETVRVLVDAAGSGWPAGVCCFATAVSPGANVLAPVTPSAGLPVAQQGTWTVGVSGTVPVSGTFWQATQPVSGTVTAGAGTDLNTSLLALESGGHLAALDGKTPALGQALAAASVPVVLPAAQVTSLTPPAAITGFALDATLTGGTQKTKLVDSAGTNVATVSAGGALKVDGSAATQPVSGSVGISGSVAVTGTFWQATQPVSGTVAVSNVTACNTGAVTISGALPGGSNSIGAVTPAAAATGGATPYHLVSAASTNATSVKASAGVVTSLYVFNTNVAARYLKLYDKATAPTVGTDTPVFVAPMPGGAAGAGAVVPLPVGMQFSLGIALAITGGIADADATAIGAADCVASLTYK